MKRALLLVLLPLAVFALAGCTGKKEVEKNSTASIQEKSVPQEQTTATQQVQATDQLPPLPTDNKKAIDSEINAIDQDLNSIDSSLSADKVDSEFGI